MNIISILFYGIKGSFIFTFIFTFLFSLNSCAGNKKAENTRTQTKKKLFLCSRPHQFRDDVYHNILTSDLPNLLEHGNITALTQLWSSGQISNFEYLTHLNKHAGRSFNDLMQYPVFPFILRDYTSETLDLHDPNIYRSVSPPRANCVHFKVKPTWRS